MGERLGVGFIGSGFNAQFHMRGWTAVRDGDVRGTWSPHSEHARNAAALARSLDIGDPKAHKSITDLVADPNIDAIWLAGPNHKRVENVEEIVDAIDSAELQIVQGAGHLIPLEDPQSLAEVIVEWAGRHVRS